MHLGNLRTALLAWLFARSSGKRFIVRIEDLDRARDKGAAAAQLADLEALGLDWDGPVWRQSERQEAYAAALAQLTAAGLVYECTCSRKDILAAPTAPHAPPGAYPGTCRERTQAEREAARDAIAPREPALRLRAPANLHELSFTDGLLGEVTAGIDDMVLRRGDGTYAYNLAVVVDDAAQGINQIVRGADLAPSTPRQILLQKLLGVPHPPAVEYVHVPLVLNSAGQRLAKRDGAVTLREMCEAGETPAKVRALLARSLGLASPGETPSMRELLARFDPARLPDAPWIYQTLS